MTQEQKDLLLKDLCSRLPYGVKCNVGDNKPYTLSRIEIDDKNSHILDFKEKKNGLNMQVYISEVKPYLFPLLSMTEEQLSDLTKFVANGIHDENILYDWYNKNHFDYRGLIPMGLANNAIGLNIY